MIKGSVEAEDIVKLFLLNNLYLKHGVSTESALLNKLPYDIDVNIAPYNRIKKISNSIVSDGNFVKVVRKYGDVEMLDVNRNDLSTLSFGQSIKDIKAGETSDVIITNVGYYIIHCFDTKANDLSLSYVFIPTVELNEYLETASRNYRFWNLTNF